MRYRPALFGLAVGFFPVLCAITGKGYNLGAILLLLLSFTLLYQYPKGLINRDVKGLILTLCGFFMSYVLSVLITGDELSNLDQPSRTILMVPILLALLRFPPKPSQIILGLNFSGIVIGCVALFYLYQFPETRAFTRLAGEGWSKGFHPIQTGGIATSIAAINTLFLFHQLSVRQHYRSLFSLLGLGFALTASLLSESRGCWIMLPVAFGCILFFYRRVYSRKLALLMVGLFILLTSSLWQSNTIQQRVDSAMTDLQSYLDDSKRFTSIGIRLDLWKSRLLATAESPLVGVGEKGLTEIQKRQGKQGLIDERTAELTWHAHNQYIETLSLMGIVGFSALLALLYLPLWITHRQGNDISMEQQLMRQALILHILMISGYCMTQAYFKHNSGITFYTLLMLILLSASYALKSASPSRPLSS